MENFKSFTPKHGVVQMTMVKIKRNHCRREQVSVLSHCRERRLNAWAKSSGSLATLNYFTLDIELGEFLRRKKWISDERISLRVIKRKQTDFFSSFLILHCGWSRESFVTVFHVSNVAAENEKSSTLLSFASFRVAACNSILELFHFLRNCWWCSDSLPSRLRSTSSWNSLLLMAFLSVSLHSERLLPTHCHSPTSSATRWLAKHPHRRHHRFAIIQTSHLGCYLNAILQSHPARRNCSTYQSPCRENFIVFYSLFLISIIAEPLTWFSNFFLPCGTVVSTRFRRRSFILSTVSTNELE